ncbi:MAG: Gfo/Idh/MocA family oxidoreductase [Planctomycetes bacterium]|nr:Gfo/Idh/MocA family oxidoreductase [Planctomycetota bacterium]
MAAPRRSAADRPAARTAGDDPRPPLRIAMVGHAFMGRAHANAFRQAERFFPLPRRLELAVVVGRDRARAAAAARRFGFAGASADLAAVLADPAIDLVDIATPNDSHHAVAMAALRAGKHVLCEKPLALSVAEARAMATLARRRRRRVGVWHNYRRAPAVALAARLIARGDIGVVRQVRAAYLQDWLRDPQAEASWRTRRRTAGSGAHGDLNAHLIDLVRALTGLEFEAVTALQQTFTRQRPDGRGGKARVDVDDAFCFLARFRGGAIGTFESSRTATGRKNHNCIEVYGDAGALRWNLERLNELELFRCADAADAQGFRTILCMDAKHPYAANWWPDGHTIGYEHTFVHHVADFVRALHDGTPFHPDFDDGLAVQRVLDAGLRSTATGRWVEVGAGAR